VNAGAQHRDATKEPAMKHDPWMRSIEAFVADKHDNDEATYSPAEQQELASNLRKPVAYVSERLKAAGLRCAVPARAPTFRTYSTPNNDRFTAKNGWVGGGSGGAQICQMVGGVIPDTGKFGQVVECSDD
jgi:hypothetical protein